MKLAIANKIKYELTKTKPLKYRSSKLHDFDTPSITTFKMESKNIKPNIITLKYEICWRNKIQNEIAKYLFANMHWREKTCTHDKMRKPSGHFYIVTNLLQEEEGLVLLYRICKEITVNGLHKEIRELLRLWYWRDWHRTKSV